MPGQRKRKQREQARQRRDAARFAPDAGHWEVIFATEELSESQAYLRNLQAEDEQLDLSAIRIDAFCGRSVYPSVYQLSRFVPNPTPAPTPRTDGRTAPDGK